MNLGAMQKHFANLYGRRNRIFLPGLSERVDFLNLSICDLQDALRKDCPNHVLGIALARVVARIFCVAEHFWLMPLSETMSRKFPRNHCSYCHNFPCQCEEKRPDYVLEKVNNYQMRWGLHAWQDHLNFLYGEKNREKGIENIINRLFKETGELLGLQMMIPWMDYEIVKIEEKFALELCDTLAWAIAVANCLDINLEQAVLERFGERCWNCSNNPCTCKHFSMKQVDWDTV